MDPNSFDAPCCGVETNGSFCPAALFDELECDKCDIKPFKVIIFT